MGPAELLARARAAIEPWITSRSGLSINETLVLLVLIVAAVLVLFWLLTFVLRQFRALRDDDLFEVLPPEGGVSGEEIPAARSAAHADEPERHPAGRDRTRKPAILQAPPVRKREKPAAAQDWDEADTEEAKAPINPELLRLQRNAAALRHEPPRQRAKPAPPPKPPVPSAKKPGAPPRRAKATPAAETARAPPARAAHAAPDSPARPHPRAQLAISPFEPVTSDAIEVDMAHRLALRLEAVLTELAPHILVQHGAIATTSPFRTRPESYELRGTLHHTGATTVMFDIEMIKSKSGAPVFHFTFSCRPNEQDLLLAEITKRVLGAT